MGNLVLVIDKQQGPSSFEVVKGVRRIFGGEKTGHAGSLDPFATGVLVLLLGRATKLSGALLNADKKYLATLKLGVLTDSLDLTGNVTETKDIPSLNEEQIHQVLNSFLGEWNQLPPMFSAKKSQGVRLYTLARKNIEIQRDRVPVQIYAIRLIKVELPFIQFEVHCSKGTYIRSLAAEIGERLGTVAHLTQLRRLSCGPYTIDEAATMEALSSDLQRYAVQGVKNYTRLVSLEGYGRPNPEGYCLPKGQLGARSLAQELVH